VVCESRFGGGACGEAAGGTPGGGVGDDGPFDPPQPATPTDTINRAMAIRAPGYISTSHLHDLTPRDGTSRRQIRRMTIRRASHSRGRITDHGGRSPMEIPGKLQVLSDGPETLRPPNVSADSLRDRLNRQIYLHLCANQDQAGFERRIPCEPELPSVDGDAGFKGGSQCAPWVSH